MGFVFENKTTDTIEVRNKYSGIIQNSYNFRGTGNMGIAFGNSF